jgi:hypothetical protein
MSAAAEPVPNRYTHRIESYQEPALVGFYTVSETPPSFSRTDFARLPRRAIPIATLRAAGRIGIPARRRHVTHVNCLQTVQVS